MAEGGPCRVYVCSPQERKIVGALFGAVVNLEINFQIMYTLKILIIHNLLHELFYLAKLSGMLFNKHSKTLDKNLMYFVNLTLGCPKMFMCVLEWKHLSLLVFVQFW